jgi:hypothetical protein
VLKIKRIFNKDMRFKLKNYVKENWGVPFIMLFMLLLVVAVTLSVMGLGLSAEVVGAIAYFTLFTGVVIQFACFLKYDKKRGAKKTGAN